MSWRLSLLLLCGWAATAEARVALLASRAAPLRAELTSLLLVAHGDVLGEDKLYGGETPPSGAEREPWLWSRAGALGVSALISAELKGKKLKLTVSYPQGAPASKAFNAPRGRLTGKVKQDISAWLERSLKGAGPAELPPPVPEAREEEEQPAPVKEAPPPPPPAPSAAVVAAPAPEPAGPRYGLLGRASPLLTLTVDFSGVSRGFGYKDPLTGNLRPYKVYFMPTPGASLAVFPLSLVAPALGGFGVEVGYRRSILVESQRKDGPAYPTTYSRLAARALWRIETGGSRDGLTLVPNVGFQSTALELAAAADGTRETELPNVKYDGLRLGVDLELGLGGFALVGQAAFVKLLSQGEIISEAFHRAGSADELHLALLGRIYLGPAMALEAGAEYEHVFFAFEPVPGDAFVAGGALDQYVHARVGFRLEI